VIGVTVASCSWPSVMVVVSDIGVVPFLALAPPGGGPNTYSNVGHA
jgi:hypothetical protein